MTKIGLQELIRTRTRNDCDPIQPTQIHSLRRNTRSAPQQPGFGAQGTMHPNVFNPQIHTLLNDLIGNLWACKNEYAIGFFGDGLYIRIAGLTIVCIDVRIDRKYLVACIFKLFKIQITTCFAFIRYANNRNLLLTKEIFHQIINGSHIYLLRN